MTTSANIAGVPTPFAPVPPGGAWPYSKKKIWHVDELKAKKKKKVGGKLYYGQVGMLVLQRRAMGESLEEGKSPQVVDKPGKKDDKYKYKGKVGVWRTIAGRRYFFPDDGSDSIPPIKDKVKKKLGGDAKKAVAKQQRSAATIKKVVSGLKDQQATAKAEGKAAKVRRIKKQIKDIEAGGMAAVQALSAKKLTKTGEDEEMEGDWADYAEEKLLPKVQSMIKKAKDKENKAAHAVLKKMEAAIKQGDKAAFDKAAKKLKSVIKKTEKVVGKQKKKEMKKARKFKPLVLGKVFRRSA